MEPRSGPINQVIPWSFVACSLKNGASSALSLCICRHNSLCGFSSPAFDSSTVTSLESLLSLTDTSPHIKFRLTQEKDHERLIGRLHAQAVPGNSRGVQAGGGLPQFELFEYA